MAINRVTSQAPVIEKLRPQLEKAQPAALRQAEPAALQGNLTVDRQTPKNDFGDRLAATGPQAAAQQSDPFARLNDALQSLEKALQALSFGGNQGFGNLSVGQDLGFANTPSTNQQFGFNDQLFQGGSWWDPQPAPNYSFLDHRGAGGGAGAGGGNPGNHYGWDRKSGGGGVRVDPGGANN